MRDHKGRFKSKELLFSLPSVAMVLNFIFIVFILLPWAYVGLKFSLIEKIYALLNSIFFDESKCNCNYSGNGDNKY